MQNKMNFTCRRWLVSCFAFFVMATMMLAIGCDSPEVAKTTTDVGTVAVKIDFNGRKSNKDFRIPCSKGSTVFSILERAQNTGDIKIETRGSGETAFVVAIDGVANEKAAGDNWTFKVNGGLGDRGSGVFEISAGDTVLWRFGGYPPKDDSE